MIAALVLASSVAYAGCGKDTDCKGDRVCEAGTCVSPGGGAPGPRGKPKRGPRVDEATLREATRDRAAATRGQIFGYSFGAAGTVFALTGSGLGLASSGVEVSTAVGGVGLVSLAIGGPLAAGGGTAARHGLQLLDAPRPGNGLRIAGWSCYGSGMFLGLVAIGVGIAGEDAGGAIGIAATIPAALGDFLLAADAGTTRNLLALRIEAARGERAQLRLEGVDAPLGVTAPEPARPWVVATPFVSPAPSGAVMGLAGVF